jgi:hypothetical protein
MAGRQLAPLRLSDEERLELGSLASRRKTAQALALRARIVLEFLNRHERPPMSTATGG